MLDAGVAAMTSKLTSAIFKFSVIIRNGVKLNCISDPGATHTCFQDMETGKEERIENETLNQEFRSRQILIVNHRPEKHVTEPVVWWATEYNQLSVKERRNYDFTMPFVYACRDLNISESAYSTQIAHEAVHRGLAARDSATGKFKFLAKCPSYTKVYRWVRELKRTGSCVGMAAGHRTSGPRVRDKTRALTLELTDQKIGSDFLTKLRPSIAETVRQIRSELREVHGIADPEVSEKFLTSRVRALYRKYETIAARQSKSAARNEVGPIGEGRGADYTNQIWEIDHTTENIATLVGGLPGKFAGVRLTLTTVLEVRSGAIIGFYLGTEEPGEFTVRCALVSALLHKQELYSRLGLGQTDIPFHGIPDVVRVDQALEFVTHTILSLFFGSHGISVERLEGQRPDLKGMIERSFRTTQQILVHNLQGTTFSNPRDRALNKPFMDAIYDLKWLRHMFALYFFEVYPHLQHSRTKKSRLQMWNEGLAPQRLVPNYSADDIRSLILPSKERLLRRGGVELHTQTYFSPELDEYLNHSTSEHARKVTVHYEPDDISRVWVRTSPGGPLFEARCRNAAELEGIPVKLYLSVLAANRKGPEAKKSDAAVLDGIARLKETTAKGLKSGAATRRRTARLFEPNKGDPLVYSNPITEPGTDATANAAFSFDPHEYVNDLKPATLADAQAAAEQFDL